MSVVSYKDDWMGLAGKVGKEDCLSKHSLSDEQNDENELLGDEQSCSLLQFKYWVPRDGQVDLFTIGVLNLIWMVQGQSDEGTKSLESDKDDKDRLRNLSGLVPISIEA